MAQATVWKEDLKQILQQIPSGSGEPEILAVIHQDGHGYCLSRYPLSKGTPLSAREWQVVEAAVQGLSNKSIAHSLQISPSTVAEYLRRIFEKWNVTSRTALVAVAVSARADVGGHDEIRFLATGPQPRRDRSTLPKL